MARDDGRVTNGRAPAPDAERLLEHDAVLDLRRTLGIHLRGRGDPQMRFEISGTTWRATRTPEGPVTLLIEARAGVVRGRAWGPGSEFALLRLEQLVGLDDDPAALVPRHEAVERAVRRAPGLRLGRTGAVHVPPKNGIMSGVRKTLRGQPLPRPMAETAC